jgi:eukaryotic-like serine/threonine-protein kinase
MDDPQPPPPPAKPAPNPRLKFIPTAATFCLKEPLGVGRMGTVYRAESDDVPSPVAVKMLHPTIAHDAETVMRFQREIVIMERLSHPHIVRHYGGGMMGDHYFFAMELLDHGTLRQRLEQGPLPWPLTALYTSQIAGALQHAHNHGIIHRDLKPTNLFFGDDGRMVLGDFGIARDTHNLEDTDPGRAAGTFAYMSPEQICADQGVTGQSDLYSLGCVAYEMLAGKPPFTGDNFAQIWDQHLHAEPRSLRELGVECPEWLDQLVLQLLHKEPYKRPFSARAVQGLIRDRLEDEFGPDYANAVRDS